jgi:hypothetical protein
MIFPSRRIEVTFFSVHVFLYRIFGLSVQKVVANITWRYQHVKLDLHGGRRNGFAYVDPILAANLPPKIRSMY